MSTAAPELLSRLEASPGVRRALEALDRRDGEPPEVSGLWGASLAFIVALDRARRKGCGPRLVVTANLEEAEEIEEDLHALGHRDALVFPAWESLFVHGAVPEPDVARLRLGVVDALARSSEADLVILAPVEALLQPIPDRATLEAARLSVARGQEVDLRALVERLLEAGCRRVPVVEGAGELSLRGDILDVFPCGAAQPLRIELFGATVDSLRIFDPETQRSSGAGALEQASFLLLEPKAFFVPWWRGHEPLLLDAFGVRGRVLVRDPEEVFDKARKVLRNVLGREGARIAERFLERLQRPGDALWPTARLLTGPSPCENAAMVPITSVERFRSPSITTAMAAVVAALAAGKMLAVFAETPGEERRIRDVLADAGVEEGCTSLAVLPGRVRRGFELLDASLIVLSSLELLHRQGVRRAPRKAVSSRAIQSFLELARGDHVVHLSHGIGLYQGIETFLRDGVQQEFLTLEFRDGLKVYVPVSKIDLVQKYIGVGDRPPLLDKVGGASWTRKKEEVERALVDLASELLELGARRRARPGHAYPPDSELYREFEAAFPFVETPDQLLVSDAIRSDMQAPRPMDRVVCGDVGYGKTELAIRAAVRAVVDGKQVAVLAPTTVLAHQHHRVFTDRTSGFPIRIDVLSRFRSPAEQKRAIEAAARGETDVLIGTHRLLSADVSFKDLGLVVIDEEQRFGVAHKERLKKLRSQVDILTLSATPIPRTLHMALLGLRDISSLTTPPEGRSPVITEVRRFDAKWFREVVIRELNREGQLCYVHNRIQDLPALKARIEEAVPEARVAFAHGQLPEHDLEERILRFFERDIDVLVSTTIIENGLDIPTVNTIVISDADHYGLADLHQLRGRVGRSRHQAYCYLLLPERRHLHPDAQKRVQALVEFSQLGAGFQIAMRDLEIRGAGNLLGSAQSGHIAAVGYEMYSRLLERAVHRLRNEPDTEPVCVEVAFAIEAFIPEGYVGGESAKLEVYRRISQAARLEDVAQIGEELSDRFGPIPRVAQRLLDVQRLRVLCVRYEIESIGCTSGGLELKGKAGMQRILEGCSAPVRVLDARTAYVPLVRPDRRSSQPLSEERAFQIALEWLETGQLPGLGATRWGARKDEQEIRLGER